MPGPASSVPRPRPNTQPTTSETPVTSATPETKAGKPSLADLARLPPTVNVETAARVMGIGRSLAYELVRSGAFPCTVLHVGNRYLIPTASLLRILEVDSEPTS